ncbi:DUF397 domain-containing protein [Streptomyces luteireticuli]|uniref:DUF397 domain-containing protein n=1 Tax=Streptomyces luteireticuli TaxID=173858 RepID=A0ABN0YZI9_9ACTN
MTARNGAEKPVWRKSTHSNGGGSCVEFAELGGQIGVRDSKVKAGPALSVPVAAWSSFVANVGSEHL